MKVVITGGTEPARNAVLASVGVDENGEVDLSSAELGELIRLADASSVGLRAVGAVEVVIDDVGGPDQMHPDREPVEELGGAPEQEPELEGEEALADGELKSDEEVEAAEEAAEAAAAEAEAEEEAEEPAKPDFEASSAAEERAEAEGIELEDLEGSGKDGRIVVADVEAAVAARDAAANEEPEA